VSCFITCSSCVPHKIPPLIPTCLWLNTMVVWMTRRPFLFTAYNDLYVPLSLLSNAYIMDLQIQSSSFVLCPLCNRFTNTKTVHFVVSEKFKLTADTILKLFAKQGTPWELNYENQTSKWSTEDCGLVSQVFRANVAGATLGKEADHGPWDPGNTSETWK